MEVHSCRGIPTPPPKPPPARAPALSTTGQGSQDLAARRGATQGAETALMEQWCHPQEMEVHTFGLRCEQYRTAGYDIRLHINLKLIVTGNNFSGDV